MAGFRTDCWFQILVHMFLLQIKAMKVQGPDSMPHKLRHLNEQFHQFQALTQARLDMLAVNQNRTSSKGLESRFQALTDHYHHMSQDLEHLRHSTTQEIEGLREWNRKLEKKNKRMEGRLTLVEKNCLNIQKLKYDPCQDFSTGELQSHEERLAALQVQRDELLIGLHGLQESLKNQVLRVNRLEGQISEVLQWNGRRESRGSGTTRRPVNSNITTQKFYQHRERNQMHKGGGLWRIMDKQAQPTQEGINLTQTDSHAQTKQYQHHATKKPKRLKAQKPRLRSKFCSQKKAEHSNPEPQFGLHLQPQVQSHMKPYTVEKKQLQSYETMFYNHMQVQKPSQPRSFPQKQPQRQDHELLSWTQPPHVPSHLEQSKNPANTTRQRMSRKQASQLLHRPKYEACHPRGISLDERVDNKEDTKAKSTEIHNILKPSEVQNPDTVNS